jgi:DNA-binding NarL/FixJ family response regulator
MAGMMARLLRERASVETWAIVETAEAALEALAAGQPHGDDGETAGMPDLVLVDVSLPGMNGIELVAELQRRTPNLPCLVMSAHQGANYARKALNNGARGFVAKGDPPALVEAVRRVLDGERAEM